SVERGGSEGGSRQGGQQHPPQRVAQRGSEAPLERLGDELAVSLSERVLIHLQLAGFDQVAPILCNERIRHGLHLLVFEPPPTYPPQWQEGGSCENHFEYNSTISCSWIGIVRSSRFGTAFTVPRSAFLSTSSHCGTPRRSTVSIASAMRSILPL